MVRIASATGVPWATSTSTWRSLATISSGLCLFLDMDPSSFGSEGILQGGPLQRGRISNERGRKAVWASCVASFLPHFRGSCAPLQVTGARDDLVEAPS